MQNTNNSDEDVLGDLEKELERAKAVIESINVRIDKNPETLKKYLPEGHSIRIS